MTEALTSANFRFLATHEPQLVRLGALAERYFRGDPNTCMIKLRQFGEFLAQIIAARTGLFYDDQEGQVKLLQRLESKNVVPRNIGDLFYQIRTVGNKAVHPYEGDQSRIVGNKATHPYEGDHREALAVLKHARELGTWFHRTFGPDRHFSPGPFIPPPDPAAATAALHEELALLRKMLDDSRSEAERARLAAEESARAQLSAEEVARKEAEDRTLWEQLAQEAEQARDALMEQLAAIQAAAQPQQTRAIIELAHQAAAEIQLDEAEMRAIIDGQLRDRGWEANTETLCYGRGVRPISGRNMAIAEWQTANGPADYALFVGTKCLALVEAKSRNKDVSAYVDQAEGYAHGFTPLDGVETTDGPWGAFHVPFVFSANGRAYFKQIETASGIWFRDVRMPNNLRRARVDWPTPDELREMLEIDRDRSEYMLLPAVAQRQRLRVPLTEVETWVSTGALPSHQFPGSPERYVLRSDVERFQRMSRVFPATGARLDATSALAFAERLLLGLLPALPPEKVVLVPQKVVLVPPIVRAFINRDTVQRIDVRTDRTDTGWVFDVRFWPGDTLGQARPFWTKVDVEALVALPEAPAWPGDPWEAWPWPHLSFIHSHLVYGFALPEDLEPYCRFWKMHPTLMRRYDRDEGGADFAGLLAVLNQIHPLTQEGEHDFASAFLNTARTAATLVPGMELGFVIPADEALTLDAQGTLVPLVRARIEKAFALWGERLP